ncbi:MAG: DUF378 domain-containing protein [Planctomycetota bacterium]|nr:MAG: DUF378 domain-containing protein [Planctomycetota bacterium]
MKIIEMLATILLIVGGLNWGLWGAFEFDLVATIFGGNTAALAKVIYVVVGLAAIARGALLFVPAASGSQGK